VFAETRLKGLVNRISFFGGDEESVPPFVRTGGRVKYPTKDLQEWAAKLPRRRVI
jgi:hypothetical protein